ncbi:MAG: protein kinase [Candidatus Coatesbacteria bacterium]|nr:protein kinase [Candidatus Coatesbacteria bacterium]
MKKCPECGFEDNDENPKFCSKCGYSFNGKISVTVPPHKKQKDATFPRKLGSKYILKRELGAGGMGKVFLGEDMVLTRDVAIKILPDILTNNENYKQRFLRETRSVARLSHPNIIQVYDFGQEENQLFYVMEYLVGGSLYQKIEEKAKFTFEEVSSLLMQLSDALDYSHGQGIIHRDLKPANIMFDKTGHPKIVDFGIAFTQDDIRLTGSGTWLGTPGYMAPEQYESITDPRSDQYSLGVILYQILEGIPPFTGKTPAELIKQHLYDPPPPPKNIPPNLVPIVMKTLEKDPEKRFTSCKALYESFYMTIPFIGSNVGTVTEENKPYFVQNFKTPSKSNIVNIPTPSTPREIPTPVEKPKKKRRFIKYSLIGCLGFLVITTLVIFSFLGGVICSSDSAKRNSREKRTIAKRIGVPQLSENRIGYGTSGNLIERETTSFLNNSDGYVIIYYKWVYPPKRGTEWKAELIDKHGRALYEEKRILDGKAFFNRETFSINKLPSGNYKYNLYLNGNLQHSFNFEII